MAISPDVVSFIRRRFGCCGLLRRSVIHIVVWKASSVASGPKMKLSIAIEMDEGVPQCGAASSLVTNGENHRQRDLSCHVSSNFVAQLAATFLQTPQTRARRRLEVRDAIRTYDDAVALGRLYLQNRRSAVLSDISS